MPAVRLVPLLAGLVGALLTIFAETARADETVSICNGYGCLRQDRVLFTEGQLGEIRRLLLGAVDAADERARLARAIGLLYGWAGEQTDIHNDRAGNYNDDGVSGRMDCIDHSTSTTRLLHMLARRGYLRWHRVLAPDTRKFAGIITVHWSAVIEETDGAPDRAGESAGTEPDETPKGLQEGRSGAAGEPAARGGGHPAGQPRRFAVDSWFVDNGQPAVILPLEDWKKGAGPDV